MSRSLRWLLFSVILILLSNSIVSLHDSQAYKSNEMVSDSQAYKSNEMVSDSQAYKSNEMVSDSQAYKSNEMVSDSQAYKSNEMVSDCPSQPLISSQNLEAQPEDPMKM